MKASFFKYTSEPVAEVYMTSSRNAFAGLLITALTAVLAFAWIPEDPYAPQAMLIPAAILSFGLLLPAAVNCWNAPLRIFHAENLVVVGIVYWLLIDILQSSISFKEVTPDGIAGAMAAIGLFGVGVRMAAIHRPWKLPNSVVHVANSSFSSASLFSLLVVSFALGIFRYAYPCDFNVVRMIEGLGVARWNAPWARRALGDWSSIVDHMGYFGYLVPILTACVAHLRGWRRPSTLIGLLLSLVMLLFLMQSGSRRTVGIYLGSTIVCWLLLPRRISKGRVMAAIGGVLLTLGVMQLMIEARNFGLWNMLNFANERKLQFDHMAIDDNFVRLAQMTHLIPEQYPHTYEKQIIFTLVRPVPRALWPGKPTSPGFDIAKATGHKNVSFSSSIIAEWYCAAGWVAVFFGGWLHGALAACLGRLLAMQGGVARALMYGIGVMTIVAGLRSMTELVLTSYVFLAWMLVARVFIGAPEKIVRATPQWGPSL